MRFTSLASGQPPEEEDITSVSSVPLAASSGAHSKKMDGYMPGSQRVPKNMKVLLEKWRRIDPSARDIEKNAD